MAKDDKKDSYKLIQDVTVVKTIEYEGHKLEFEVRTMISWKARNILQAMAGYWDKDSKMRMNDEIVEAIWDAVIVRAPFPKSDMARIPGDLGELIESAVFPPLKSLIGSTIGKVQEGNSEGASGETPGDSPSTRQ